MELNLTIQNTKIHVKQTKSSGPAILFLHGNSLSSDMFRMQLSSPELAAFRLISFDFQGHGKSGKAKNPKEGYGKYGIMDTVNELFEKLKIDKTLLVGHSFGGHVAIESLHYLKDKVDGLLIFGTPPLGFPPAMEKAFMPVPESGLAFKPDLNDNEVMAVASLFCMGDENINNVAEQIKTADPNFRAFIGMSLMNGDGFDEVKILEEFTKPVAIFMGEKDPLINLDYFNTLTIPKLWKNKIHLIKNSGHSPQLEQSEAFNSLLKQFSEEVFS
ncbi:MAG: alpha/beta hydrolase [Prolixibacteraceae bacterium]|jgi:pimeloyl-ACP methyl ester carboxylesterase|nr:alpha/beta hydrolase [Prolixibacteraceae bacterium]